MLVRRLRDACAAPRPAVRRHVSDDGQRGHARRAAREVVAERRDPPVRRRGHARSGSSARRWCGPPSRDADRRPSSRRSGRRDRDAADRTTRAQPPTRSPRWVETTFGLRREPDDGPARPAAARPRSPDAARRARRADRASTRTTARRRSARTLLAGSQAQHPATEPAAVRVPAAPVPLQGRHRLRHASSPRPTASHHQPVPGRRARTSPTRCCCRSAFCRECGQEYLVVARATATGGERSCRAGTRDASGGDAVDRLPVRRAATMPWPRTEPAIDRAGCPTPGWSTTTAAERDRRRTGEVPAAARSWVDADGSRGRRRRRAAGRVHLDAVRVLPALPGVATSRSAAATSPSWPRSTHEGRSLGDDGAQRQHRAQPAGRAEAARRRGPQAAHLRRQPAGRQPAGRALQRLRPGRPAPRRAVPGGRRGRRPTG